MSDFYVHNISPIFFEIGPLAVRWYGLMYLVGFVGAYQFSRWRHKQGLWALPDLKSQDLATYLLIGMLFGARLIYVFVYNPEILKEGLVAVVSVWQGGLSYHGAAAGFAAAMWVFGKRNGYGFMHLADNVALCAGLGVFFGRIGNFINGELYGRVTDVPWAVVFPDGGGLPRHPSQLYQGLMEGLLVFIILLLVQRREIKKGFAPDPKKKGKKRVWQRTGIIASVYFMLYGLFRFLVEFVREPDSHLGYYLGWMTMGQILCLIMIAIGAIVLIYRIRNPIPIEYEAKIK